MYPKVGIPSMKRTREKKRTMEKMVPFGESINEGILCVVLFFSKSEITLHDVLKFS